MGPPAGVVDFCKYTKTLELKLCFWSEWSFHVVGVGDWGRDLDPDVWDGKSPELGADIPTTMPMNIGAAVPTR